MRESSAATYIHTGKESLTLTQDDLDDRIINLKFARKSGKSFIIRSDSEAVHYSDGTTGFMKCTQKPSITVKYVPVSRSTATNVTIDVKNLFVSREFIGSRMDAFDEDPIQWITVQLGYRKQFPDWTDPAMRGQIDQFYDLNNNSITTDAEVRRGREILVQALDNYLVNGPPSSTWRFEGVVGTLDSGLRWNHTEEALNDVYSYGVKGFPEKMSQIEAVFYQWVTRRFIRPSVQHHTTWDGVTTFVYVYGYNDYKRVTAPTEDSSKIVPDKEYTMLKLAPDGLFSIEDANLFGIKCTCSKVLCQKSVDSLFTYAVSEQQKKEFGTPPAAYTDPQDRVGAQLVSIQKQYPFIRWYVLSTGDYFIYHVNESESDLFNDPAVKEKQKSGIVTLPAVYSISMGGMRTISAPFVSFIDPLTTVRFNSRYTLSDISGYFYRPERGNDYFTVILATVVFSTDGKGEGANCMTLSCIDLPNDQVPEVNEATGMVTVPSYTDKDSTFTSYIDAKKKRNARWWREVRYTVGDAPYDKVQLGWIDIAKYFLLGKAVKKSWPSADADLVRALTDLKAWNTTLWNNNLTNVNGDSLENSIANVGFKIPWLYSGNVVVYRTPYRAEYDADFQED